MLDAGAAVRAAVGVRAAIAVTPAAPVAGETVTLSSVGSTAAAGRTIVRWQWALVEVGGVASAFTASTNAPTTTLRPSIQGVFTVHLSVTDDLGVSYGTQQTVTVAAAPVAPPEPTGSSGGGGVMSWLWLLALVLATVILAQSGLRRR
jgi:serine protease